VTYKLEAYQILKHATFPTYLVLSFGCSYTIFSCFNLYGVQYLQNTVHAIMVDVQNTVCVVIVQ